MEIVFFIFLFLAVYPYGIYPGVVYLISRLFNNPWHIGDITPPLTIVISVYNEEKVIGEKLKNTLSLEYPEELLEIVVISDGSTDKTNEIVSGFKEPGLVLKAFPERSGKTTCLNRVVPDTRGEIILFTDANSMFPRDVLLKLVKNFLDERVGLVTGWTKYVQPGKEERATGFYGKLERGTKYRESLISSCVGADGAIFAVRKNLYNPLMDEDINDFVIPLHVISQRKRVVLDPKIFCFEESSKGEGDEFRRQVRITNRTLRAILRNPVFLNPFRFSYFSFFLLSHKLLRFMVPFFAGGAFLTNLLLAGRSTIYFCLAIIQILLVIVGLANIKGKVEGKAANICTFFLLTLSAQFSGWIRMVRGVSDTMWTPQR